MTLHSHFPINHQLKSVPFIFSNHQPDPAATEVTNLFFGPFPKPDPGQTTRNLPATVALQEVDSALGRAHDREGLRIASREGTSTGEMGDGWGC